MKLRGVLPSLVLALVAFAVPGLAQAAPKQATLNIKGMVCES